MARESATSPRAASLPVGGGDIRGLGGNFTPDYNRGTGSFTFPLRLPPGPRGSGPRLTLTYSSGGANGAFGLGWSLGVSTIHRDSEARFLRYDASDPIALDGHGDLVELPGGTWRPREDLLFARITRPDGPGGGWVQRDPSGTVRRFGSGPDSRISDPDDPGRVLAWAIDAEVDSCGNHTTFRWNRDGNNLYLAEVRWSVYRLALGYEPRPDVYGTARHGFPIETRLRCTSLDLHCARLPDEPRIRSWELDYSEPEEIPLSLLAAIRCHGFRADDIGAEEAASLPALTFAYSQFTAERPRLRTFAAPRAAQPPQLGTPGVELVDLTGDGLPDVVQLDGARRSWWRNRGDGGWDPARRLGRAPVSLQLSSASVTFADLDGDGLPDLVVGDDPRPGYYPKRAGAVDEPGWGSFRRFPYAPPWHLSDPETRQVDLDGDGRLDLLRTGPGEFVLYLNDNGDGWKKPRVVRRVHDRERFPDVSFSDPRVHLADMTGDGLSDIVLVHSGAVWYWPYEDLGRWGQRRIMAHPPVLPRDYDPARVFLADLNGDGVADLVYVGDASVTVWLNQFGSGFAEPEVISGVPSVSAAVVRTADLCGTGTSQVIWSWAPSQRNPSSYAALEMAPGKPYLLTGIDNGLGRRTTISYGSSPAFAADDRAAGRPWPGALPFPLQVVAEVRQHDEHTGVETATSIRYHDGQWNGTERRFAGFREVEVTDHGDPEANTPGLASTFTFDQSATEGLDRDARAQAIAAWGKLLNAEQRDADTGELLQRVSGTWTASIEDRAADDTPVVVVHQTRNQVESHGPAVEGTAGPLLVTSDFEFDDAGNVRREHLVANGPVLLERTSTVSYAQWSDGQPSNLPAQLVETGPGGRVIRELGICYDGELPGGLPAGQAARGLVTRQRLRVLDTADFAAHYAAEGFTYGDLGYVEEDGAVWAEVIRATHDEHGNPVTTLDPLGNRTRLEWDAEGLQCVAVTNPLGHTTRVTWDDHAWQPREIHDANGAVIRFGFDPLGRVDALAEPGDDLDDPTETVSYALDTSPPAAALRRKLDDNGTRSLRRMFYTGSGETLGARAQATSTAVLASAAVTRNRRNWIATEGEPFEATTLDFEPAPAGPHASYHYDAIGRITAVTYADGAGDETDFGPFGTRHTDARGHVRLRHTDGWGRVIGFAELHDGTLTAHRYDWDEQGRLLAVRGPGDSQILGQRFDLAGNRLTLVHREAGTRQFYYDAAGREVRVVDAAGNRIDRTYDELGRPTEVRVDNIAVQRMSWDDTSRPNRIGRLSSVTDEAGDWSFEYDDRGRIARRALTEGSRSWALEHRWNPSGSLAALRYPDGVEVPRHYDLADRLTAIPGWYDEVHHDARGRRTAVHAANGVQTLYDYTPGSGFLRRLQIVGPSGQMLYATTYERDETGNVIRMVDPTGTRTFSYDGRDRLIRATSPTGTREYTWDEAGNPTRFPGQPGELWYDPPGTGRLAGTESDGTRTRRWRHDANGNVVELPGRTLTFDALGRITSSTDAAGNTATYQHNLAGDRVWRTVDSATSATRTLTLAGLWHETVGAGGAGAARRYVRDGAPIGRQQDGSKVWLHTNDTGNVVLVTNAVGAGVATREWPPFGEAGPALGDDPHGFAGQPFDEVSGLYHFAARDYDPSTGRFVSPDPLMLAQPHLAIAQPALHNPYAYAADNPLAWSDPFGLSLWGAIFGGLAGGIVGAAVFVASGGNPILAGLAGGFVGGAVAGAIDGGLRGAVIGGLVGGLTGALSGATLWGISALGGLIGGNFGQTIASTMASTAVLGAGFSYAVIEGGRTGNWDVLAGMAAGMTGAFVGSAIANSVLMKGMYANPNSDPRIRQIAREAQAQTGGKVPFDQVRYAVEHVPNTDRFGSHLNGVVTFNETKIGNDYLEFRRTLAHELYHAFQQQTIPNWNQVYAAENSFHGYRNNIYEAEAENFAMRFTGYTPYPFKEASHVLLPVALGLSMPASHDGDQHDIWSAIGIRDLA
ncbi:toxin TcdB middle/N-terminal domain-containing protein [Saccharopolyspora shandongensis]|uniref:toxin TcdB middle/N-terminal domain-containing protein n=1 Tax=Saccharopolyspora shandongensis TaxID=418495 RepID=UPI00343646C0